MCAYDPLQANRRLWNYPERILDESIAGSMLKYENLMHLDTHKAILRRDCDKLNGKVRIIGGGAVIDGPTYAGFVGPGMLTAAVLGLYGTASFVPTSDTIFEVINYVLKGEQRATNGVLLLVHDCPEYFVNFSLAKTKAESKGIPIKMVLVRDELSDKLNQKPLLSPRSPSGLLLMYKIAGAMSEEGKSLDEIYHVCDEILRTGAIYSTGVYIVCSSTESNYIEICRGDRLSNRDIKRFDVKNASTRSVVEDILNDLQIKSDSQKYQRGSKLCVLLDYFGGFTELEANIVIKELVQQFMQFQIEVEIIYAGTFRTSLEANGFHLSILNLSNDLQYLCYLKAPTLASSWPKTRIPSGVRLETKKNLNNCDKNGSNSNKYEVADEVEVTQEVNPVTDTRTHELTVRTVLLTAIEYACESLLACASKIDTLDNTLGSKNTSKCGTRLANTAKTIKTTVCKKNFTDSTVSMIVMQVATIFKQSQQDDQAELYAHFFNNLAKALEDQKTCKTYNWFDAFTTAINAVATITKGTQFLNVLSAAKEAFCKSYAVDNEITIIQALEQAVFAAQNETSHIIPESKNDQEILKETDSGFLGIAGAHALGIWMRGAYEGIKLEYSRQKIGEKRIHLGDNVSGDLIAQKMPKLSEEAK